MNYGWCSCWKKRTTSAEFYLGWSIDCLHINNWNGSWVNYFIFVLIYQYINCFDEHIVSLPIRVVILSQLLFQNVFQIIYIAIYILYIIRNKFASFKTGNKTHLARHRCNLFWFDIQDVVNKSQVYILSGCLSQVLSVSVPFHFCSHFYVSLMCLSVSFQTSISSSSTHFSCHLLVNLPAVWVCPAARFW